MDRYIIELIDLTKVYGTFTAVDKLNLAIPRGEIYGLLGPNGAGKSTAILMMLGLTEPISGTVNVCGINSTTNPIEVRRKVGYLPEDVGFYEDYTGLENLVYTARLNSIPPVEAEEKAMSLLERVGLKDEAGKKAGKYSRGMRQRLGLADVLIKSPEVIILDEPTLGIDPKGVQELLDLIVRLSKEEGHTVLLSSHHLHQVQEICDRVGLIVNGKLIAEGNIASLSQQLFADEPLSLEAGLKMPTQNNDVSRVENLIETLRNLEGVMKVNLQGNELHIGCSQDNTEKIVEAIIKNGVGLSYLNKKEYGLNEIYNRYFEEVNNSR
ncbi:MAG: ABC transporter ATP-binding protein [Bacteroidales bacterium]|nr:ABC transporter ATP-binding protein [Bacteroidales bacterium]